MEIWFVLNELDKVVGKGFYPIDAVNEALNQGYIVLDTNEKHAWCRNTSAKVSTNYKPIAKLFLTMVETTIPLQ